MTWKTKLETGVGKDENGIYDVNFWIVEQDNLGFACYSEDAALYAANILNRYEDIRQSIHKINLTLVEQNIYSKSTKSK